MTKEEALNEGIKVMEDIGFLYNSNDNINVKSDNGEYLLKGKNTWLISFHYGLEDYGKNVGAHVMIMDETGRGVDISYRNGYIKLGYDEENDKYFVEEQSP